MNLWAEPAAAQSSGAASAGPARVRVRFSLRTSTPLRVGSPGAGAGWPELRCARTRLAGQPTVYLPGASLRGALRAVAARRLGCRCVEGAPSQASCLVCRTFGHGGLRGRVAVPDLLPVSPAEWLDALEAQARFGEAHGAEVPLDFEGAELVRANGVDLALEPGVPGAGAVAGEVVPAWSTFWGEVVLQGYQAWQLGLLALGLRALDRGEARLGGGRSRGRGRVTVRVQSLRHEQPLHAGDGAPRLWGELATPAEAARLGLRAERGMPEHAGYVVGLTRRFDLDAEAAAGWLDAAVASLGALP